MRITVLKQTAKGLPIKVGEGDEERELRETALKLIESAANLSQSSGEKNVEHAK